MEAKHDFWSISENNTNRHHVTNRENLFVPREESFPIPLKHIDVVRHAQTNSDMSQEHKTDDYWNADGERPLSGSWIGFTAFTILNEPPMDTCGQEKN